MSQASASDPRRTPGLGLPETGRGSMAGFGRRLAALCIDWFAAIVVTSAFVRDAEPGTPAYSWVVLAIFAAELIVLTTLSGASFGQRILGLRVASLRGPRVDPLRVVLRTLLICLAVPPLIIDGEGRGLHDKAAGSVVVRA